MQIVVSECGIVQNLVLQAPASPAACNQLPATNQNNPFAHSDARTLLALASLLTALAVTGCSIPPPSVTAKLTSGISVIAPVNGASVTSPFTLTASATNCESLPATSMAYSIDDGQAVLEPASFNAKVTADPGPHVVHVTCLGQDVSSEVQMNIQVISSPAAPAPAPTPSTAATPSFSLPSGTYSSAQTVSLSSATTGATIYFTTDGSAPSTSSKLYSAPVTVASSLTLQAIAVASGYNNSEPAQASYVISAAPPPPTTNQPGPAIPSYALSQTEIQLLPHWRIKYDPATPGSSTGSMTLVSDPSLSGQAAKFYTTFTNAGGELYSVTYGNDTDSKNFLYDAHIWISSGSTLSNLEMDNNQVMRNGDTVIYAFQCSGYSNTWEFSSNTGTPSQPNVKWIKSTSPCNPSKWTRDTWHHIQISTSRDDKGNVTYHSVWFDGTEAPINTTVNSDFSLGWALGALVANFQVDGIGTSGSSTLYLDHFTMYRW